MKNKNSHGIIFSLLGILVRLPMFILLFAIVILRIFPFRTIMVLWGIFLMCLIVIATPVVYLYSAGKNDIAIFREHIKSLKDPWKIFSLLVEDTGLKESLNYLVYGD